MAGVQKYIALPLALACFVLAVVLAPQTGGEQPDTPEQSDLFALVQTYNLISRRGRAAEHAEVGPGLAVKVEPDPHERLGANAQKEQGVGQMEPCAMTYEPLSQQVRSETLRFMGWLPPQKVCRPKDAHAESLNLSLAQLSTATGVDRGLLALAVPFLYVLIFGFIIVRMLMVVLGPKPSTKIRRPTVGVSVRRPEAEAWRKGLVSWLTVSWANEWVARWGHADGNNLTSVKADELDGLGDPEDEPNAGYKRLKVIWREEVARKGINDASLLRVMLRFTTLRRLLKISLWTSGYEVAMYLGPPLAIQHTIGYVSWLYTSRLQGVEIPWSQLLVPSIMVVVTFTGLPLAMAICNTVSGFLCNRLAIQSCGALSSLVVRKAQSLPMSVDVNKADLVHAKIQKALAAEQERRNANLGQQEVPPKAVDEDEEFENDPGAEELENVVVDQNNKWKAPAQFNLVQVVANDINMSFVQVPMQLSRTIILIPVCFVLFVLVYLKVKATIFLVIGTALICTFCTMRCTGAQIVYMMTFLNHAGSRLQLLENSMFSIRTVKACGWEGIVGQKIQDMRKIELQALEGYYWRLGVFYNFIYTCPKALILSAVFGHHWLYPNDPSLNIFATLPLLFTAQSAIMSLVQTVPALMGARPSIMRCESFLKQLEAPLGRPKEEFAPSWLTLWPAPPLGREKLSAEAIAKSTLCMQGSFSFLYGGKPVLKDVDICVPSGKSLAVIGHVGSGKTTFLHAMLGELHALDDSRVSVPQRISYSAQVPYVCEGTLRENILFGEPLDDELYQAAVFASCLLPDLEVLPGGEDVPIGSRGISLSGGQKARVSMARAAYSCPRGGLFLVDDPFGAVDSRTARHILDNLIHGPALEGRTRVVVTQPDPERITRFDQVCIIADGRIIVQGSPAEVMETEEYQGLLNSHQVASIGEGEGERGPMEAVEARSAHSSKRAPSEVFQLREEEFQGRTDWATVDYFCSIGRWPLIVGTVSLFLIQQVCFLMMNVMLQHWSSDQMYLVAGVSNKDAPLVSTYLKGYMLWWGIGTLIWVLCWICGVSFTLRMSSTCFKEIITRLLHAPVDRFYDRTPVGRIMNRLSSDLMNLDYNTYTQITVLIALAWQSFVPIAYIHVLMPIYFTLFTVPLYFLIGALFRRYWFTMVPMRYLTHCSKSSTDDLLSEVSHSNVSIRAMQKADFRLAVFQSLLTNQIKADVTTTLVLQRWIVNRLFLLSGFFITVLCLAAVWIPAVISFGGIGLCLCNCFQVVVGMEGYTGSASNAQFQFISMNRLFEYTKLPQEKPNELPGDSTYQNFVTKFLRKALGKLEARKDANGLRIVKHKEDGGEEVVLTQVPGVAAFQCPDGKCISDLVQDGQEMQECAPWHRIVAANGCRGDIYDMASELCNETRGEELKLEVQSGWLVEGAEVIIEDLRVGYGEIPRDVLKDINVIIEPRTKAGIVGTTGCGKSTLLLSLLRILEPRDGRILINGVDTQKIGLQTLRSAVGLVPQDPVLMQASVRENLDPFNMCTDDEVRQGLRMVQLEEVVGGMPYGMWTPITADGGNLSFGQRQLLCLARTVIRQPALLLLDEATSALDPYTQELVQTTIESSFPKSTIIVIAHRLETILNFDLIIVMEQGCIAEKGSVKDLQHVKGGIFAKMLAAKRTW